MEAESKYCSKCDSILSLDRFTVTNRGKPHTYCKACRSTAEKERLKGDPVASAKRKESARAYREAHRDELRAYAREYARQRRSPLWKQPVRQELRDQRKEREKQEAENKLHKQLGLPPAYVLK